MARIFHVQISIEGRRFKKAANNNGYWIDATGATVEGYLDGQIRGNADLEIFGIHLYASAENIVAVHAHSMSMAGEQSCIYGAANTFV